MLPAQEILFGLPPTKLEIAHPWQHSAAAVFSIGSNILTRLSFSDRQWMHYWLPYSPDDPPLNSGSCA